MPKGLVRYQQCGCFHYITFGCYHRFEHLGTVAPRNLFERSLEAMRRRYDFVVCGYVVMPEHVHLLVSEPNKALLSKAIQALKLSVSVQSRRVTHRKYLQKIKLQKRMMSVRNASSRSMRSSKSTPKSP